MDIIIPLYLLDLFFILTINITVFAIFKSQVILIKRFDKAFLINLILLLIYNRFNIFFKRVYIL